MQNGDPQQIPGAPAYQAALYVAGTLRAGGHQAFFAGGCVRDLLLGVAPKDFDVATSATPDAVQSLFPKTLSVGAHFGVVLVCGDGGSTTEVATFRHDGSYTDGRRPDTVRFSTSPEEDVLRRDFTINGMLLDPILYEETGDLVAATFDFVGGQADLASKTVRAIGNPALRFEEDKLRMLRAVRFAARLRFTIEPQTMAAIQRLASTITQVSSERIRDELTKMLTEGHARRAFELLDATGLLAEVLPESVKMHGVPQPPEFHPEGDVWVHTMLLLEHLPPHPTATLAWGALLHDIGKPATFRPPDPGKPGDRIRFNGHVEVGVRIAEAVCARLRFSNDDTAQIVALVQNHMRFGDILQMKQSTLKRFLRLPRFDEHLALHWLDCTACHGRVELYHYAKQQYEAEPPVDTRPKPLVTGRDLIAAGYPPSPQFKPMLELAEDAQLEGTIHTLEEGLTLIREQFRPVRRLCTKGGHLSVESRIMTPEEFHTHLQAHAASFARAVATDEGGWIVKGFIDVYKRIYTISVDTKLVSKVLELLLVPMFHEFAAQHDLDVELAPEQNFYPDLTFRHRSSAALFAVDIKSTYRTNPNAVNGMTLGAFTGYFRKRESRKNTLHPYGNYSGHFVLGVIYSKCDEAIDEKKSFTLEDLQTIPSVIKDFYFFAQPKFRIAVSRPGSGNTKNIGSVTKIEELIEGKGPFSSLGESIYDDYWMFYLTRDMAKALDIERPYTNLKTYLEYKKRGMETLRAHEQEIRDLAEDEFSDSPEDGG